MFGEIQFLLFHFIIFGIALSAAVCGFAYAGTLVRNAPMGRKWIVMVSACFLSFATPLYLDFGIIAHAWAQHKAGEDNFLDGTYHYRLPNNYELVIFDKMPDYAWMGKTNSQLAGIEEIRGLQVSGDWLLVAHYKDRDEFRLIRTSDDSDQSFFTIEELRRAAAQKGITLDLLPVRDYLARAEDSSHLKGLSLALFLLAPLVLWIPLILVVSLRKKQKESVTSQLPQSS